jgi:cell division protein FtsL
LNARLIVVVVMLGSVIGSALGVVYTRHESRLVAVRLGEIETSATTSLPRVEPIAA